MSPWDTWDVQNNDYNHPGKRRIDEVNCEIESIKQELMMNDFILKNELEMRLSTDHERALVAAELYKDRLLMVAQASRSQILRVSMDAAIQQDSNPYQDNGGHGGWDPKRKKFNHGEDSYYNYSNQYASPQNAWSGYSYNSNTYYTNNRARAYRRGRKRKAAYTNKPPVQPTPGNALVKINTATFNRASTALVYTTTAPVKTTTATVKMSPSAVKPIAVVKTFTATAKNNSAGKAFEKNVSIKTEFYNNSSLISTDQINLQFGNPVEVTKKSKNSDVVVKIEPNDSIDSMHDDLKDHL